MMESAESRRPPRPGMRFPESFVFEHLFKTDSTRSPKIAVTDIETARMEIFQKGYVFNTGKQAKAIRMAMKGPVKPPMKPIMLLFGLAATYPRLFLPIDTPNNQAQESHPKISIRKRLTNALISGKLAILLIKDMKYPQKVMVINEEPSL